MAILVLHHRVLGQANDPANRLVPYRAFQDLLFRFLSVRSVRLGLLVLRVHPVLPFQRGR